MTSGKWIPFIFSIVIEGGKFRKMLSVYKAISKTWILIFDEVFGALSCTMEVHHWLFANRKIIPYLSLFYLYPKIW
jgi:hypothetical protein